MSAKLKVGIIGTGGIARGVHIPNYQGLAEQVEVVAVADVNHQRAQDFANEFHIHHAFASYEEMLHHEQLDAISICTPNKFHSHAAITALEAGCHVLCEKPPAITVQEAELMQQKAEETGKLLTYGFHYRHTPEAEALRRYIKAGELGDIYMGRVSAIRRRGIPGWGVFTNKELQGGGPLIDIGVHMLDLALYLMDYPEPDVVVGSTYQKLGNQKGVGLMGQWDWENYSIEDMALGMLKFKNGATIMLETAFAANVDKDDLMQVSLMGDQGGADTFPLKIYQEKHDTLVNVEPVHLPKTGNHGLMIERFVQLCQHNDAQSLTDAQALATPRQGVIVQKILGAIYQSAESGEAVKL